MAGPAMLRHRGRRPATGGSLMCLTRSCVMMGNSAVIDHQTELTLTANSS